MADIKKINGMPLKDEVARQEIEDIKADIESIKEDIENLDIDGGNTNVNLEEYAKKTEIPTKTSQLTNDSNFLTSVPSQYITESELNTTLSNYAKKSEVPQQPNFTFKINMVSEGQEATVVTSGTYPNMTFTSNIPQGMSSGGESGTKPEVMYIGYIPYDETGVNGLSDVSELGENLTEEKLEIGVRLGTITKMSPTTLGKTSIGNAPVSAYVVCVFPAEKNYTVTIDNGIGGKDTIDNRHGEYPVNNVLLKEQIGGRDYQVSGFLSNVLGERFFYVD